jgi:hypothetical protein
MTTTPLPEAPVRSPIELTARWSDLLLNPPTFSRRSLWLGWMGPDGVMLPLLAPVDDLPHVPDPRAIDGMLGLHRAVVENTGAALHLATALSRPGSPTVTANDAVWAEALRTGVGERIDGSWSLHLAASGTVTPMVDPPAWAWAWG